MIIVRLRGGLGNQMFQYALGRTKALRDGSRLVLDASYFSSSKQRRYGLSSFALRHDAAVFARPLAALLRLTPHLEKIVDRFRYETSHASAQGNILLDGYWESYKYLVGFEGKIRQDFRLASPTERFEKCVAMIPKDSIAVHVRRGDFVGSAARHLNSKEYYEKAVAAIVARAGLKHPEITIFSDDPEWCRKELGIIAGFPAAVFEGGLSDAEELMLMSHHGHIAISNSTFSWWAAFLGERPGRVVAAPTRWYRDPAQNAFALSDLVMPGWITIEAI
jgi:hypothetical protein